MKSTKGIKKIIIVFLMALLLPLMPYSGAFAEAGEFDELIDEGLLEELEMTEEELEELLGDLEDILEAESDEDEYGDEEEEEDETRKKYKRIKVDMVFVKGGCYMMGDNFDTGQFDEQPVHKVCLDDFYISETEVTQRLWKQVMGFNPAVHQGLDRPIEYVGWMDANDFIDALNNQTGKFYRMPTEAEWEYAARGGARLEQWPGTNDEYEVDAIGWSAENSGDTTFPVKSKAPNSIGLYDMGGNVWEWVYDYYDMDYYNDSPEANPEGPEFAIWRGLRGGSFSVESDKMRTSTRYGMEPTRRTSNVGFRLAQ